MTSNDETASTGAGGKQAQQSVARYRLDSEFDVTAAGEIFAEYFISNYPGPNTIISRPGLHAPKIFRAAIYAIESARSSPAHPAAGEATERGGPPTTQSKPR